MWHFYELFAPLDNNQKQKNRKIRKQKQSECKKVRKPAIGFTFTYLANISKRTFDRNFPFSYDQNHLFYLIKVTTIGSEPYILATKALYSIILPIGPWLSKETILMRWLTYHTIQIPFCHKQVPTFTFWFQYKYMTKRLHIISTFKSVIPLDEILIFSYVGNGYHLNFAQ